MQRVSRREAVAIEGRRGLADRLVRDEGPLAHECPLQPLVDEHAENARERHRDRRAQGLRAEHERQRDDEQVPGDSIAQAARDSKQVAQRGAGVSAVQAAADPVFRGIHPCKESTEGTGLHDRHDRLGASRGRYRFVKVLFLSATYSILFVKCLTMGKLLPMDIT